MPSYFRKSSSSSSPKIPLDPAARGSLLGYHILSESAKDRRDALRRAVRLWGTTYVIKKLTVLGIYRKYSHPHQTERIRSNVSWVQSLRDAMPPKEREADRLKWTHHGTIAAAWKRVRLISH